MPTPKPNYFQEYSFNPDEEKRVAELLADPLLQAYIQNEVAKFAKDAISLPLPRADDPLLQVALDTAFNKGALELANSFVRLPKPRS